MVNTDYDDSVGKVRPSTPLSPSDSIPTEEEKRETGLSSIEKSKKIRPEIIPPMDSPLLAAPLSHESLIFGVASLDSKGFPIEDSISSFILKGQEASDTVVKGWAESIREIQETVKQLLNSPLYHQLQEIRMKDIHGPAAQGVTGGDFVSTLNRLETVSSSEKVSESEPARDASHVLLLPLSAALLVGGGLALETIASASPLGSVMELVQSLQPLFPAVAVQDLVPIINLMVVGPIYYNSWKEAVSNLKSGERHSYVQTAQNFAKDVIKIVTDPHFVNAFFISRMRGTDKLSPKDQQRLDSMLKIVLIGVALSLLYSVEMGKVQKGKFGGIEPEELRDLLLGNLVPKPKDGKKLSVQELLTSSLIARSQEFLALLSKDDRVTAAQMLYDYITKSRDLDPMLDPAKVFDETLASSLFNPKGKVNLWA